MRLVVLADEDVGLALIEFLLINYIEDVVVIFTIDENRIAEIPQRSRRIPAAIEEFPRLRSATALAASVGKADLVVTNNMDTDVPDLLDVKSELCGSFKPSTIQSMEFTRVASLVFRDRFDTIFYGRFRYLEDQRLVSVVNRRTSLVSR